MMKYFIYLCIMGIFVCASSNVSIKQAPATNITFSEKTQEQNKDEKNSTVFNSLLKKDIHVTKQIQEKNDDLNTTMTQSIEEDKKIDFSFMSLYQNAHIIVKVVIYILCFLSLTTWTIFFYKILHFRFLFKNAKKGIIVLADTKSLENIEKTTFSITSLFIDEINDEIQKSFLQDSDLKQRVRYRLESKVNMLQHIAKSAVAPLATIGSSAPFIGLFGTVWGIMNSFIGIANAKNISLNIVAPGIAEALFATALGLVAAIPAVVLYNYLIKKSNNYVLKIKNIASDLIVLADRDISYKREGK